MGKLLSIDEAYEKYFSDRYATKDIFYMSFFANRKKIVMEKKGKFCFLDEDKILQYLEEEKEKKIEDLRWLIIIEHLRDTKKLQLLGEILDVNYLIFYSIIRRENVGKKYVKRLTENKTLIYKIIDEDFLAKLDDDINNRNGFGKGNEDKTNLLAVDDIIERLGSSCEYSYSEIAEVLEMNTNHVKALERSAIKKIIVFFRSINQY